MKKQLIIIGIVALLVCVGLSGCEQLSRDNRFVGTWKGNLDYSIITFFSDGTFTSGAGLFAGSGTWEIKDGKLVLNAPNGAVSFNFVFSNNDNTLTLTLTGSTVSEVFTKQ